MEPFRTLESQTVVLPIDNIDTDQIIPARFLTVTTKEGLGEKLFADWREDPDFVLNRDDSRGAQILVPGENFGCGSSREHAPWALIGFGFRAVVSVSIADIFKGNAVKNGLLPVEVDAETHRSLLDNPGWTLGIDLDSQKLTLPGGRSVSFALDGFARHCLLQGIDQLDFLLAHESAVSAFESGPPLKIS
ncbi:MAG TPA: 3-isopropylmalate dehydratase small subunit [Vicinamibacteria bacterium]|nr:3-isopropylmalate dehydratase small subunit [Vicinamibacteria bacterium]